MVWGAPFTTNQPIEETMKIYIDNTTYISSLESLLIKITKNEIHESTFVTVTNPQGIWVWNKATKAQGNKDVLTSCFDKVSKNHPLVPAFLK